MDRAGTRGEVSRVEPHFLLPFSVRAFKTSPMTSDLERQARGDAPPPIAETAGTLPQAGEIFDGKYRIERTIGQGAMAVVLEATHLQLEDRVAIKLLLPQWAADPALVERFMREGRAATRIRSEHVVRVFDVGVAGAHPYLVMEYLDGYDLDRVLAQEGPLPVGLAIDYLLQACEAIAEAHVHGVIHRDLKPANLFLTRRADGSACVKVLDFGISKATIGVSPDTRTTEPTTVMGSPHYMSPEQMLSSRDVDARADVWALGAILHELLVAAPPFDGETIAALSASVLRDPAPPLTPLRPDVPPEVEAIVLRCLEKEPANRFANVAELATALSEQGGPSSHASAERIARVVEGGATGKLGLPLGAPSARPEGLPGDGRAGRAASLLAATVPPHRSGGRVLGYVVAGITFTAVAATIVWMVVKDDRAMRAAEQRDAAPATATTEAPSAATTVASAAVSSGATAPSAEASATHGEKGHEPPRDPANAAQVASATPAPRAPIHARGPRHTPHPPSNRVAPLPDFPVPSDPQGEPSSRPVAPLGASPPASAAPVSTANRRTEIPPLPTPSASA